MNLTNLALLCGLITSSFVHKSEARLHAESIVVGNVATVDQHSYAVSIQVDNLHICGGGILNNRYILTAAHCFINLENNKFDEGQYIVVAGVTHAFNITEPYRITRAVERIYIPTEFDPIRAPAVGNSKFADIAVLALISDLGLNRYITNVVLPPNAEPHPPHENQPAIVCGYGDNWVTMGHDPHTNQDVEVCSGSDCFERRFAEVNIITNTACRNIYSNIMDGQLCGHMVQRSRDKPEGLCTGDSGAPLVIGNTIVGVVCSSSRGCREDVRPAIYTRVTTFLTFIRNAMNGVRTSNMRLAKYEVRRKACGRRCNKRILVEL